MMRKSDQPSILKSLRSQGQHLSSQHYPGDLAKDLLESPAAAIPRFPTRRPVLAFALLGIGLTIWISLMPHQDRSEVSSPIVGLAADPPSGDTAEHTEPQTPAPLPTISTHSSPVAAPVPEIDRGLLPLQRNSQATWLASAKAHQQQIDKQARLAEHPKPSKRLRITLSTPTRRNIGRITTRPLSLQPAPKPERTS